MTEQEKNKFAGMLLETYGLQLSPQNELLPLLYIMYGLEVQMGRTSTKFLESISMSEKSLFNTAKDVVDSSVSYISLVTSLGNYQKKLAESTEENKSLLNKLSDLQTAHIKLVNEQNEAIKDITNLISEVSEKEDTLLKLTAKFEILINSGGFIQQEAPKKKKGFFGIL